MIALDTNTVIDLARGREVVRDRFDEALATRTPMAISAFVLQELLFGVARAPRPDGERAVLAPILAELEVLPFETADAEVGGRTRALMEQNGRRAPLGDFIIGVHALARGHALVTANTRDFRHIPGLELVDWTQPAAPSQD